jgi:hypothetical protein
MFSETIAATVVFFGSAFWFNADDPRHAGLLEFEKDLKRPAIAEGVHLHPSGLGAYALIGKICLIIGIVLIACIFTPSTQLAPASLNVVAGTLCLILGVVILYFTRDRSLPLEVSDK